MTTGRKQLLVVLALSCMTAMITGFAYHAFRQEWILFRKAESRFAENAFADAIPLYEKAIQAGLNKPVVYFHLAKAYERTENFTAAAASYRRALLDFPEDRILHVSLARLFIRAGNFEEAIREYRSALGDK